MWTRSRGSKRIRFRTGNGRFARAPSLEAAGAIAVCKACCGMFAPTEMVEDGNFVEKKRVEKCPHCGAPVDPRKPGEDLPP